MAKAKRKTKATKARPRKSKKRTAAKPAARAKTRKPQRFVVSHHREEDFDQGLRPYSAYRDLGIAPATVRSFWSVSVWIPRSATGLGAKT